MTKATKNTIKSVAVLSVIAVICVALLAVANGIFPKADTSAKLDEKTVRLLNEICSSESYEIVYGSNDDALADFNKKSGNKFKYVNALYRATGETNNGRLIVEAVGNGHQNGAITVLVAYDSELAIMGVALKSYDGAKNNYVKGNLVSGGVLDSIFEGLVGASGSVGNANDISSVKTGATNSLNGVATAINLAYKFISGVDISALPPIQAEPIALAPDVISVSYGGRYE